MTASPLKQPARRRVTDDHPDVVRARAANPKLPLPPLGTPELVDLARAFGADDAGVVRVDHPELAEDRPFILEAFPRAKAILSFVLRMNRENVRSPARSVANLEFHQSGEEVDAIARRLVRELEARGVGALNPAMAFPMESQQWPARMFIVSHKRAAQAAGLGRMGLHRNLIHPRFGNFLLLGSVLLDLELAAPSTALAYEPCLGCNLCVAACPVGAIHASGRFDALTCMTHNYREFMGGFTDWIETVVDSKDRHAYRAKVSDGETVSMWQSLAYKPNYKAAYCLAVCPAGSDVLGPFLDSRAQYLKDVVDPLRDKPETIYVLAGSDAEAHVQKRFPHKQVKHVHNGARPQSPAHFLGALPMVFQPGAAKELSAVYHFDFTGSAPVQGTVTIKDGRLQVTSGLVGQADLRVEVDGDTWLAILDGRRSPVAAVLTRKLKLRGPRALLDAFQRCFPS